MNSESPNLELKGTLETMYSIFNPEKSGCSIHVQEEETVLTEDTVFLSTQPYAWEVLGKCIPESPGGESPPWDFLLQ